MLRIKPLLFGVLTEALIFFVLLCGMAYAAKGFGHISGSGYLLAMEFFSAIAVLAGAFLASRCAWEKGAVYGGVVAITWIILRVILMLTMGTELVPAAMLIKAVILLLLGVTGGTLGVGKRDRKMI